MMKRELVIKNLTLTEHFPIPVFIVSLKMISLSAPNALCSSRSVNWPAELTYQKVIFQPFKLINKNWRGIYLHLAVPR